MRGYRLLGALAAVLLCSQAHAAKVAVETGARLLPATACLVGTYDAEGRPDAAIIDRVGIAETPSKERMIFYVAVNPKRQTAKNIEATGAFTVNVMNAALVPQGDFCGTVSAASGDEYFDKFSVTGLKLEKGSDVNAPVLTECPVTLECKLVKTLEFPDGQHRVYLGEVASYHVIADALDGDKTAPVSQFDPQKSGMAVYFAGSAEGSGYYALSAPLGRGMSAEKFPWPNGLEPKPAGH